MPENVKKPKKILKKCYILALYSSYRREIDWKIVESEITQAPGPDQSSALFSTFYVNTRQIGEKPVYWQ